jgi:hypothetical protein
LSPNSLSDLNWRIAGVADIARNGVRDGKPDLVWQRDGTGDLAVWYMDGLALPAGISMNPASVGSSTWKIVGVR